jgi:RNA polymerase sigma-70 factor (ECF subfamily)
MADDSPDTSELLERARAGDPRAAGELFERHRSRLRRMVQIRLARRLRGRIDPSDVLQETYMELSRSLANYLRDPQLPFFLWLRYLTGKKIQALHRRHLGTHMRDAHREVSLQQGATPCASSESLAAQLLGRLTTPSQAAMRAELRRRVQEALDGMSVLDREVLALRHFEQLSNAETARVLGITEAGASNRYVRALKRLKSILGVVPGILAGQDKKAEKKVRGTGKPGRSADP